MKPAIVESVVLGLGAALVGAVLTKTISTIFQVDFIAA